ncbi:MAG: PQQ-like beta-propeller repeat protein, partial [Planctomycetales bacterium]
MRQDKSELKNLTGEARKKKEAELKALDVRRVVALDAATGKELWRRPVDVTFCSGVSAGGGSLAMMFQKKTLVVCGANANGHYWRQFLSGEFNKRRLVGLNAEDGEKLWSRDADYMNRPAIINDMVLAEPWAFDLRTGAEQKRVNPLTGKETKWQYSRPGHHCGVVTATPNMMFFRSGFIGYYDLYADSGTRHFAGQRLGCWVNALPANGLVVIPEASAGCVCLFSITSTVVLEPREDRTAAWGIYSVAGPQTPVKSLAVNLGAPGDRRDQFGTLWLSYPRPRIVGRMEYAFNLKPTLAAGGKFYARNEETTPIEGPGADWVYASGAKGLTRFEVPLLSKDDKQAVYKV